MTNLNDLSQKLINTYQKKICCYDKQQWERSIEDQILFRAENICGQSSQNQASSHERAHSNSFSHYLSNASTKTAKVPSMTNDLIDLDLISGSAYTVKAKSQQGWLSALGHAVLRVLLFPLYIRWWADRTGARLTLFLLLLYLLEVVALRLYYHRGITLLSVQNGGYYAFGGNETTTGSTNTSGKSTGSASGSTSEYSEVSPTEVLMPIAMAFVLGVIHTQIVGTKSSGGGNSSSSTSSTTSSSATLSLNTSSSATTSPNVSSATANTSGEGSRKGSSSAKQTSSLYACKGSSAHTDHSTTSLSSCNSSPSTSSSTTSSPPTSLDRHTQRKQKRLQKKMAGGSGLLRSGTTTVNTVVPKIHISKERDKVEQFDGDADADTDDDDNADNGVDDDGVEEEEEDSVSVAGGSEDEEVDEHFLSHYHQSLENLWADEESEHFASLTPRRYSESASRREKSRVLQSSSRPPASSSFSLGRRRSSESQILEGNIVSKTPSAKQSNISHGAASSGSAAASLSSKKRASLKLSCPLSSSRPHRFYDGLSNVRRRLPSSVSSLSPRNAKVNSLPAKAYRRSGYHASASQHLGASLYDSEGTISPVTPIASLPGDDWPMINSDANTSGESDDENNNSNNNHNNNSAHQFANQQQQQQPVPQLMANRKSKTTTSDYESNGGGGGTRGKGGSRGGHCCKSCCCCLRESSAEAYGSASQRNCIPDKKTKSTAESGDAKAAEASQQPPLQKQPPPLANTTELKVSCSVWTNQNQLWQKVDLSVMDLSSAIIRKVDGCEHSSEYVYLSVIFSVAIALLPSIFRMQYLPVSASGFSPVSSLLPTPANGSNLSSAAHLGLGDGGNLNDVLVQVVDLYGLLHLFLDASLFYGNGNFRLRLVIAIAMFQRFALSLLYFFLLCVAERTFKQRFLYSKYFSQITRRDRAKRSQVPFFRLHKVSYLKVWLSVRSYLRRHGPLRSVDTICSTSFIIAVCLLTCICLQLLKDDANEAPFTSRLICWEMIFWSLAIGIYIMRLMILGSRINQKYRSNLSVLITEQINLHLQLERKPQKKDDLMLANHVLKLAADLIKELEAPYKISGFSANPYLYNITKVVVLSAFSALLTEMLGFKLKLDKINLIK